MADEPRICVRSDLDMAYRNLARQESRDLGVDHTPHAERIAYILDKTEKRTGRRISGAPHMELVRRLYANRPEEYEKRYGIPYRPVDKPTQ